VDETKLDIPEKLIWGYGLTRPKTADPTADFGQHFAAGFITLNLAKDLADHSSPPDMGKPPSSSPPPANSKGATSADAPERPLSTREKLILGHALALTLGFLFLLPLGSLTARWGRTFTAKWFRVHRAVNQYISLPLISLGFFLGPVSVIEAGAAHISDIHKVLKIRRYQCH
jgi:hypothetical protein